MDFCLPLASQMMKSFIEFMDLENVDTIVGMFFQQNFCVKPYVVLMYPVYPEGTQVIIGSVNM